MSDKACSVGCGHPPDDHEDGRCMHLCDCAWPSDENDAPLTHVPFIKAPMPDRRDFPRDTADYDADEDDFNQCPHEAIRATCPGCTCPCNGCERWRERDRARVIPPEVTE